MCGIFAYAGSSNQGHKYILDGLKSLEYRGYDSWGVALQTKKQTFIKKQVGKIGKVKSKDFPNTNFGLGHTRWATHGGVTRKNSHPHHDCEQNIFLVHNGIIENYSELKDSLKDDHIFLSQTDTEVLVHLIEEERKSKSFKQAVFSAFKKCTGLSAIIAFEKETDEFVVVRNGSPLVLGFSKGQNFIASDPSALIPHTKEVYFLKDNQAAVVNKDKITCYNLSSGNSFTPKLKTIKGELLITSKGNFDHFMIKEIIDQNTTLSNILNKYTPDKITLNHISKAQKIIFLGCGTASHAAMVGHFLFSNYAKINSSFMVGSEMIYYKNLIDKHTLVVALSQSGETMDTIQSIKLAKKLGAKILSLVNVEGSTLDRLSHHTIPLKVGVEKAVASTKAFTSKLMHLYILAAHLGKRDFTKFSIEKSIKQSISPQTIDKVKKISKKLSIKDHMYVVGRGVSYPISLETALKIKEVSYIHAEGFAAGELKHGVIALIEKGTPCIVYAPRDQAFGENIAAAMELKARGGFILGISPQNHEVFDYHIPTTELGIESMFQDVIIGQLLGYYIANSKKIDPDMPRNLAKSVTVK